MTRMVHGHDPVGSPAAQPVARGGRRALSRRAFLAAAALAPVPAARADPIDPIARATVATLGGMVGGRARPGPWRIGFSDGYGATPWRRMATAALWREVSARPRAIAQLQVRDAAGSVPRQIADLAALIRARVDAILCIPNSPDALNATLGEAITAGIVTVAFNLPLRGEAYSAYVGTDPEQKGRALGAWLVGALRGQGRVVGLGGLPGNPYSAAAWRGAEAAFAGTGLRPLIFTPAWWDRAHARAVMAGLIGAYPEIDGVWCDGGQDAAGAIEALRAARRKLVPVTGDDNNGLLKLYAALAAEGQAFDFALIAEPSWQSVIALRAALTLLAGGSVAKRQMVLPAPITPANYARFIRPNLPDATLVDTTLSDQVLAGIFG